MPSQPVDPGWNFGSVYNLIDTDSFNVGALSLRSDSCSLASPLAGGIGLGDFGKLYDNLGWLKDESDAPLPPFDDSELSNSDDALLPSPLLDAIAEPLQKDTNCLAQANSADVGVSGLTKKQRRKARRRAEKARLDQASANKALHVAASQGLSSIASKGPSNVVRAQSVVDTDGKIIHLEPRKSPKKPQASQVYTILQRPTASKKSKKLAQFSTPKPKTQFSNQTLPASPTTSIAQRAIPATPIQCPSSPQHFLQVTVPRQSSSVGSQTYLPATPSRVPFTSGSDTPYSRPTITIRSQVDRHMNLFNKLMVCFPDDRRWLVAPRQLVNETTQASGVHIFVDASNIMFGFRYMLRACGVQRYDMSFDSLALLMERRRPVAKRVFVGSHREAKPLPQVSKLVETSKAVGYECNVQEQVYIVREKSEKQKFYNDVKRMGWHRANRLRSSSGSDSEMGAAAPKTPSAPKWVEQGVDELLHLKMCQSIIDTEQPTTMVLATGDGAAAEMSDGFLAHVERGLRNGWKVELITWKQQTNGGYRRKSFRQKWGEQFTIIELDDFLEDLIDTE